ncbi:DNA mismatch repair protein MutS [Rhynchospora pubera]|uniref:DNA mismatch repair protein MutS n=1 Tax=Rhynchospora pubera TaxID=906938 RepID=A0AAV8C982_9POAL|nr:DNA mismatch repair protein MutS [Rhynchospora pubera]
MHRQKSILSFLQKPQSNSSVGDVRGTDTPPEKPRRAFVSPMSSSGGLGAPKSVSSILQKLARPDDTLNKGTHDIQFQSRQATERNASSNGETPVQLFPKPSSKSFFGDVPCFKLDFDEVEPETPALRPLVPGLKRVQEESPKANDSIIVNQTSPFFASNKKVKRTFDEESESGSSKFDWLNPSNIRDANRRRPGDPLYDKRTLYIPPDALRKMSASQKQYWSVKCKYMDVVLFFKVGKFYELYEIDAEIGQKELDWKMTVSGVGKCRQVGISEAGIDDAVQKLIARGYKVGRIEQLETADQAKARGSNSVIQRKLVHVSTPSTVVDGNIGPDAVHLLALTERTVSADKGRTEYGFAFLDCAALKFWVGSIADDDSCASLGALLVQVSPRELIFESSGLSKQTQQALKKYASGGSVKMQLTPTLPSTGSLDASQVQEMINSNGYFGKSGNSWSSAFDYSTDNSLVLCALGGIISQLSRLMLEDALKNGEILPYHVYKSCLRMDGQTLVNLEIFSNNVDGGLSGTLYKHLDHCLTASGKRLLKRWICHPLKDIDEINSRLDVVEGIINNSGLVSIIHEHLRRVPDLERLLGQVKSAIGSSAALLLPVIGQRMLKRRVKTFGSLVKGLRMGVDLLNVLDKEDHGVPSLSKVVNIPNLKSLDEFVRQFEEALDNDFPKYQDHDVKDSDADTLSLLVELFAEKSTEFSQVINTLSMIDVLQSFAATSVASWGPTSRPLFISHNLNHGTSHVNRGPVLKMKGLWHPYAVAESSSGLVPNDVHLGDYDRSNNCALLLTGPNMGGKSTLMRATCLSVILAQLGCYVPCESCELSPADIIFTRLGATDRIMAGESTFYVECAETASVLRNATQDSLVLLDELGRGTSTFDGYAIAYAVFRHLVEKVCCRLLFATHYHPLTKEFASHPRVSLQHMACVFQAKGGNLTDEKELIFLYRLTSGACPESYGLQVALMAGIPKQVVEAASEASQKMKVLMSENFKSSVGRSEFSTLHEDWLKAMLAVSGANRGSWDEDASDTILCLWHEIRSQNRLKK